MKRTLLAIGIAFLLLISYFGTLGVIAQSLSLNNQIIINTTNKTGGAMVNIGVGDVVSTQVKRPLWYGDVIINHYEKGSVGRINILGLPIIVILNNFDWMIIHIILITLFSFIIFIIFMFELNLYGGNTNEKMD